MPVLSAASAVHLGSTVVDRLYLGATLVFPTSFPQTGAIAAATPMPVAALASTATIFGAVAISTPKPTAALVDGSPAPPPYQRVVLVVSPRRVPHFTRPGAVHVLTPAGPVVQGSVLAGATSPTVGTLVGVVIGSGALTGSTPPSVGALTAGGGSLARVDSGHVDTDVIGA